MTRGRGKGRLCCNLGNRRRQGVGGGDGEGWVQGERQGERIFRLHDMSNKSGGERGLAKSEDSWKDIGTQGQCRKDRRFISFFKKNWSIIALQRYVNFNGNQLMCVRIFHPSWASPPSPADLPDPEIEPRSPALQADSRPSESSESEGNKISSWHRSEVTACHWERARALMLDCQLCYKGIWYHSVPLSDISYIIT